MESHYRKIPGKNWQVSFLDLSKTQWERLTRWIETQHQEPKSPVYAFSQLAMPVFSTTFCCDDRCHLVVEFRSRHEHHQDYLNELTSYLRELLGEDNFKIENM